MIMDHSKTSQKLEDFVTNNPVNIAIPENMDGRRSAMIENLRKASDDEFDSVYMGQQAAAHDEALNLHKSYASRGDYPKLTALAAETAKIIEHHRNMIAKVQAARSEEHTSELQSLMRISYAVFCLKNKTHTT